jgi:hypothetical protein
MNYQTFSLLIYFQSKLKPDYAEMFPFPAMAAHTHNG